jgi:hypothetical protein
MSSERFCESACSGQRASASRKQYVPAAHSRHWKGSAASSRKRAAAPAGLWGCCGACVRSAVGARGARAAGARGAGAAKGAGVGASPPARVGAGPPARVSARAVSSPRRCTCRRTAARVPLPARQKRSTSPPEDPPANACSVSAASIHGTARRDLRDSHLPLLAEVQERVGAWLATKHKKSFHMFFHYMPSVFQLHLHVTSKFQYINMNRAHFLKRVVKNLQRNSELWDSFVRYKTERGALGSKT